MYRKLKEINNAERRVIKEAGEFSFRAKKEISSCSESDIVIEVFIKSLKDSLKKNCFLTDIVKILDIYIKEEKNLYIFHVQKYKNLNLSFDGMVNQYVKSIREVGGYDPLIWKAPTDQEEEEATIMRIKLESKKVEVVSIFISIDYLFSLYNDRLKDTKYKDAIFIFYDMAWSNIVLQAKYYGIDISGGNPSKRHLFSSVDYHLANFLFQISKVNDFYSDIPSTIKLGLKDPFLTTEIPLDKYNKFLNKFKINWGVFLKGVKDLSTDINCDYDFFREEDRLKQINSELIRNTIPTEEAEKLGSTKKIAVRVWKEEKEHERDNLCSGNLTLCFSLLYLNINKSYNSLLIKLKDDLKDRETRANNGNKGEENKILILTKIISEKEKELLNFKENFTDMNPFELNKLMRKLIKDEENFDRNKEFTPKERFTKAKQRVDAFLKSEKKTNVSVGSTNKNNQIIKRHYSSVRVGTKTLEEEDTEKLEEVPIDSNYLRDEFLKNVSYFGLEMRKIVNQVNSVNTAEEKLKVQNKIEEYCLEFEERSIDNIIMDSDSKNKFDPLVARLILDWNDKLVKALDSFTHAYEINNYEKLIKEIKKNNGKGELFLLIFVLKYKIKEKNLVLKQRTEEIKKKLAHLKKKTRDKIIYNSYARFIECDSTPVVSQLISILVNIISNNKNKDKRNNSFENSNISMASLKSKLGEAILNRAPKEIPNLFFESNKNKWDKGDIEIITNFYNENIKCTNCEETIFTIGNSLFELIQNTVDIFEVYGPILEGKKSNKYVHIKDSYFTHLNKKLAFPNKLPMVINPIKWDLSFKENIGGFLNHEYNSLINNNLIHKNRKNLGETNLSKIQTDSINFLNSQKFKINKEILTLLLKEFKKKNSFIFQGKNVIHPETANYLKLDLDKKKEISAHNSKFNLYKNILTLAVTYENVDFYLPTYFDFRGRIYSIVDYLNYQGEDISRGLIEFSNGCELDNENILYVLQYLANTSGKSKLNVFNKTKWAINILNNLNILTSQLTKDNLDILFNHNSFKVCDFNLEDLINNSYIKELLLENDEKLQFLVTLLSLIKFLLKKSKFNTPICFDATCSGFQHLSAIFLDIEMAVTSNVSNFLIKAEELEQMQMEGIKKEDINNIPQKTEPGDIYMKVVETVKMKIHKETDDIIFKEKLLKLNITRELLKRPVMTIPYNVGLNTMGDQLVNAGFFIKHLESMSSIKNKETKEVIGTGKVTYFYTVSSKIIKEDYKKEVITFSSSEMGRFFTILYFAVYETFPSLEKYINYLNKIADIFGKLKAPIIWTTPVGMKIKLAYGEFKTKPGKNLFDSKKRNSVTLPIPGKINHKANKTSFVPNLIHSMDSANIQLLIHNLKLNPKYNYFNLFTIHDCFATTPDAMKILNLEVRKAFSLMYFDERYLNTLHLDFLRDICRYTNIYKEDKKGIITPYSPSEPYDNYTLFFYFQITKKDKVRFNIPNIPFEGKWEIVKDIFETGITNSLYFIA
uniref:DNA-directed RNA polymerase n=1 Tax=Termitomyces sp. K1Ac TaxID=2811473 RepID=A0A8H2S9V6_9AGAR|nr:RNA polymerase [Termitomyces sp. K1Ac]